MHLFRNVIVLAFLSLFLSLFLSGCAFLDNTPFEGMGNRIEGVIDKSFANPAKEHPEDNLQKFLGMVHGGNYSGASQYISEQSKQVLQEEFLKAIPMGEGFNSAKVEFAMDQNKKVNPLRATVYYRYNHELEGILGQEAVMVKENGAWKVLSLGASGAD